MVKVDKPRCISCGNCMAVCPDVFEMGKDGKSQVKKGKEKSTLPCVAKAITECPTQCISK
ncbi:MAG: ferredoxin [Nanoarchaeota archaeon]